MKRYRSIGLLLLAVMTLLAVGAYLWRQDIRAWWRSLNQDQVPVAVSYNKIAENTEITEDAEKTENTETENSNNNSDPVNTNINKSVTIPDQINLDIPFTSQAPTGNWDALHEEACEEASVLMAARFLQNRDIANAQDAEAGIQELTGYVADTMHYPIDLTAEQMVELIQQYYPLHAEVIYDWTWDDVKQALAQGYPVLVPAAGRMLGNPNYTAPGPLYHVLVIKGYTANRVITNDSGTRHGADYQYDFATVEKASHDWNNGDVANGKKVMIIVKP